MKYYLGIDIGGTNIRAAIVNEKYNIIDKIKLPNEVNQGAEYNFNKLSNLIEEKWNNYKFESVGVGCPGPLDIKNGIILHSPNLSGWEKCYVKKYFEERFNVSVNVNNDANVAGLSEAIVGAGKGAESIYYITLSTGVGGGFIYKGEIISGFNSVAAEIGNMIINEDSYKHANMNYGGLEGQCSGTNIGRIASKLKGIEISTEEVFSLAKNNDKESIDILKKWTINVSKAIANIIVTVDPEAIVLGGSVILYNKEYLQEIINEVKKRVYSNVEVDIRLSTVGDETGLIGAGILAQK